MDSEKLYQSIFKRKSVRKFEQNELDDDSMSSVRSFMGSLRPMVPGIRTELRLMGSDDVKGMFKVEAPHYLALFSEEKEGYLTNAGFLLQQMDLFFNAYGIGCCWQGGPKPTKKVGSGSDLEFIILLAFGIPAEELNRDGISQFNRVALTEITDIEGKYELLEPARIAPSAMNKQSWYFTDGNGSINVFYARSVVFDKFNQINSGIALCHLWLAAEHSGDNVTLEIDGANVGEVPKGYAYSASLYLNK